MDVPDLRRVNVIVSLIKILLSPLVAVHLNKGPGNCHNQLEITMVVD